jgi:molecular chaperone IbpA
MNDFTVFDFHKLDPFAIGFNEIFRELQEGVGKLPAYPPYNIKQVKDNKYVIEMAVAGFGKSDIEITLEGNKLVVSGSAKDNELAEGESFFHKGIANRNFKHSFKLADKVEIENAEMVNGMLKIWLENLVKTQDSIKKIAIKSSKDV